MVLTPLAVMLLAQLGLLMLLVMLFQRMQKRRLLKELQSAKPGAAPLLDAAHGNFNTAQVELLLNRVLQTNNNIFSEAPSARDLCQEQQKLVQNLAAELDIQLENLPPPSLKADTDLVTQQDINSALGREEALEEFDMLDLDSLESSDELIEEDLPGLEDDLNLLEEDGLPEDTLQAAIDKLGNLDSSSLEEELNKI